MLKINDKRLRIPLNNFWVSEPYSQHRGFIGIGKLSEDKDSCLVFPPGKGKIERVDTNFVSIVHEVEGRRIKIEFFNLTSIYVTQGQTITKGEPFAEIKNPHLRVRAYILNGNYEKQVHPLNVLYAYPDQVHRNHIPRHTPKPVPRKRKRSGR